MEFKTNEELELLVMEQHIKDENEKEHYVTTLENKYMYSSRHKEHWNYVFFNPLDTKMYSIEYSTSVKDSMGFDECNDPPHKLIEVIEKEIITKTYVKK